nr:uncharacterized protein LOC109169837 [Ipomoea trifida]
MDHPIMATKRTQMIIAKELEKQKARFAYDQQSSTAKYYNDDTENYSINPKNLWLNKKGCPIGSVPIRQMSKQQLQKIQNLQRAQYTSQKLDNHSYVDERNPYFAGLKVGNPPSGRFTGAKATMSIWNPTLRGDHQYSSASLYVEDGDNQIRAGWIVYPELYGDSRTRLFSRWTSDNYGKTGCYINHCPGFVITSNIVPLDYPFPNMSEFEGKQFEVRLEVVKHPAGDWELNYNGHTLGKWTSSIFSKMSESASQLRFGGECYEPEGQDYSSPGMGSGRFKAIVYTKTCYMRQVSFSDIYGDHPLKDDMVQVQMIRCYFARNLGYNSGDGWAQYAFLFGGGGDYVPGACPR